MLPQTATRDFAPDFVHAHNLVLQVLFASGAVGLALFIAIHLSYVRQARLNRDHWRDSIVVFVLVLGLAESVLGEVTPRAISYIWIMAISAASVVPRTSENVWRLPNQSSQLRPAGMDAAEPGVVAAADV